VARCVHTTAVDKTAVM